MVAKGIGEHDHTKQKDGVHRAVFEEKILLDVVDATNGNLPHDDGSKTIAEEDDGYRQCEGKRTEHPVNAKGGIDHLKIENLADIREMRLEKILLTHLGILFKTMRDEKGSGTNHGTESHKRMLL